MKTKLIAFTLPLSLLIFQSCTKISDVVTSSSVATSTDESVSESLLNDSSLICYLPFSGNFRDKSRHGNNGTPFGSPSFVADRFGNAGKAVSFAASNTWIEIPQAQFNGLRVGTFAMDFYATSTNHQVLMGKMSYSQPYGSSGWYQSFVIVLDPSGLTPQIQFASKQDGYCSSDQGWNQNLYGFNPIILNQWNHLAITFNDSIENLYLNGTFVSSVSRLPSPICGDEPIRLGVWWQQDPQYFTGYMDELRIYNRVLSAKEVRKLSTL